MSEAGWVSTRIEKEYDFLQNDWIRRVSFIIKDQALYSGFMAEISPLQLHTLISLSLFMKENGKIEISVAELAQNLGVSYHQAAKRIEDLANFRFQNKPIIHMLPQDFEGAASFEEGLETDRSMSHTVVTILDNVESTADSLIDMDGEYLFEYLRHMLGVAQLSEADIDIVTKLQEYPYEMAPPVIEILIEHVLDVKSHFDHSYVKMVAHLWSDSLIQTREEAEEWVMEKAKWNTGEQDLPASGYLLQYLRERLRREPSGTQVGLVLQLLEVPYQWDSGCVEVLIDHVVSQMLLTKGKTDFPKRYVEVIANEWLDKGVRTRAAAIAAIEEWNQRNQMYTTTEKRTNSTKKSSGNPRIQSEYLQKLKKAGL